MPDPNQPQEDDAVLGGETPIPTGSAILGGIEGVKRRLASAVEEQRIAALSEALNYGEAGLDLVIGALQDESKRVEHTADMLIKERGDQRVKRALREESPLLIFEHSDLVFCFAISPDRQTIVSGSKDKTIKVWHLETGQLIKTLEGHSASVKSVAISPDRQTIVSGSADNTIKIWGVP